MPMIDIDAFLNFKSVSEEKWRNASISDTVWGLQIQAQTRWNPGLTDGMITQYEILVGASFHPVDAVVQGSNVQTAFARKAFR
jgi:hypothetical protein